MDTYKILKRKFFSLTVVLIMVLFCTACSSGTKEEKAMESATETERSSSLETDIPETDSDSEEEAEEPEAEPDEVAEESVEEEAVEEVTEEPVEEDTNHYGNTIGNIYNNGVYAEYEDGKYLMRNSEGQVYVIDPISKKYSYLNGMDLYELNYSNGKVYGIMYTQNEQYAMLNDQIVVAEIDDENYKYAGDTLEERKPEYMYVVNDVIYYSDSESHRLISYNPETGEEKVLVDSEIYYPSIYKDTIIFQNDPDGESLYSVSIEGGEITKLNDMRSYWPIVYQDKIYYQGVTDAAYTLRCMEMDGSEDTELAGIEFSNPVICGDKLCFLDVSDPSTISYLDLKEPDSGVMKLDIGDRLIELYADDEEVTSSGTDVSSYRLCEVSNPSCINGCLMFWTLYVNEDNHYMDDNAMYDFDKEEVSLLPWVFN